MAKRSKPVLGDNIRSFERGISHRTATFLNEQYDFVTDLQQKLVEYSRKNKGAYSKEIDDAVQGLGHLLAKGGLISGQPEVIAAGELLVVVSALIRAVTAAWDAKKDDEQTREFLYKCKCSLKIIEGVEKASVRLSEFYGFEVPRQHAINMLAQSVAMTVSTRHHFAFHQHPNHLQAGNHSARRFYRVVHHAMMDNLPKIIEMGEDVSEINLATSTLREVLAHCALPQNNYERFYYASGFRNFEKTLNTAGKTIKLRDLFVKSAIIVYSADGVKIHLPPKGSKYQLVPPMVVYDIDDALGADRACIYDGDNNLTLSDLGIDKDGLQHLPQVSDIIGIAQQCCLICDGKVYRPKKIDGAKMEVYKARLPALHVAKIPAHLQAKYVYDPNAKADDYNSWENAKLDYASVAAKQGFFAFAKARVNNDAMTHAKQFMR